LPAPYFLRAEGSRARVPPTESTRAQSDHPKNKSPTPISAHAYVLNGPRFAPLHHQPYLCLNPCSLLRNLSCLQPSAVLLPVGWPHCSLSSVRQWGHLNCLVENALPSKPTSPYLQVVPTLSVIAPSSGVHAPSPLFLPGPHHAVLPHCFCTCPHQLPALAMSYLPPSCPIWDHSFHAVQLRFTVRIV